MGVPITFMDKYNPEQFEIIGLSLFIAKPIKECIPIGDTYQQGGNAFYLHDGKHNHRRLYGRIAIKRKRWHNENHSKRNPRPWGLQRV